MISVSCSAASSSPCGGLALNADLGARLWPLFVLPAVTAGLTAFDNPARNAIVPNLVAPGHLPAARGGTRHSPGAALDRRGVPVHPGRQGIQGAYLIDINAMVFGMPRALFPAMAVNVFRGGAATVGFLYAAPGVGALATGWVARPCCGARSSS